MATWRLETLTTIDLNSEVKGRVDVITTSDCDSSHITTSEKLTIVRLHWQGEKGSRRGPVRLQDTKKPESVLGRPDSS